MQARHRFAIALAALTFGSGAFAETRTEQQNACQDDAYRLCSDAIPDEALVERCLEKQLRALSPQCRSMFGPSPRRSKGK